MELLSWREVRILNRRTAGRRHLGGITCSETSKEWRGLRAAVGSEAPGGGSWEGKVRDEGKALKPKEQNLKARVC